MANNNTNTIASTINRTYFNNMLIEASSVGYLRDLQISTAHSMGDKVYRFSDNSMLISIKEMAPMVEAKLRQIKTEAKAKAEAKAKIEDSKNSRYIFVSRALALYNVESDKVDRVLVEHLVISCPSREEFESKMLSLLLDGEI